MRTVRYHRFFILKQNTTRALTYKDLILHNMRSATEKGIHRTVHIGSKYYNRESGAFHNTNLVCDSSPLQYLRKFAVWISFRLNQRYNNFEPQNWCKRCNLWCKQKCCQISPSYGLSQGRSV